LTHKSGSIGGRVRMAAAGARGSRRVA
jgi:hypothetical protein